FVRKRSPVDAYNPFLTMQHAGEKPTKSPANTGHQNRTEIFPLRVAWLRVAWLRVAWLRVAWLRVAWLRVAWLRVAWLRVAWLRVAWF
ncbi:MAG: hypothetical protein AAF355_06370, partial [Myxococcota bacterium]